MGALDAPQDRHGQDHRTGTSRAEQITEAMAKLGALEAMAELGAPKAMAGARSSGGHGGAGSSGGHGRWSFMAVASSLGQATPAGTLLPPPPKKNFPGEVRGYQEPSGARQTGQDRNRTGTGQPSRAKQTGTGSPPGLSSEAEASSGQDMTSGALTESLSNRFHFHDKGAGGWEWPPRPLQEEPPAPDESPWTRPTRLD